MPVTPDEIRTRYRQLVRELHPDLNPGTEERMKAVNVASERLTGLEPDQLDGSGAGEVGFEFVISFGPVAQADWIYATATRLYVLDGDSLVALEDCTAKCDLLVGGGMVLLVEAKGVRVFTEDGRAFGVALTKAPIRRAYVDDDTLVVETRTQRGRFRRSHLSR